MSELEELEGSSDAAELARVARALDPSVEAGPRAEFLATLRARIEREAATPRRGFRLPRLAPALGGALAAAVVLAVLATTLLPQAPGTAIPPEQRVIVGSASGFSAYDPVTLREREFVPVGAPEPWVMLAADQRTLVFTFGAGANRRMRILDLGTPREFRDVRGLDAPQQFALSSDGARAYVRDGAALRVVDIAAARVESSIATPGVADSPVYLAPDDRRLFQFRAEGELIVFDVLAGREMRRVPIDLRDAQGQSASARVVFSPDGRLLYAVGSSTGVPSGPVRVLVLDSATLATVMDRTVDPSRAPRLSRSEPGASVDGLLGWLGFIAEAKELGTVTQIALSPDGRLLYAARGSVGDGILLIDTQRLEAVGLLESSRAVFALQLTRDGSRLFALAAPEGSAGQARLLAIESGSYRVVATVPTRTPADTATLLYKP